MSDPAPFPAARSILLPAALDPAQDGHGSAIAAVLPERDGGSVALPDLTYVFIVFTNRSGSTYLGELLASTGYFNAAEEALNADTVLAVCKSRGIATFARYFAAIAAERSRNGHFFVKAAVGQLAVLAWHGILGRILPRARFIVVERMDKLGQAISWHIAAQTGLFTSYHAPRDRPPPAYSREALTNIMVALAEAQARTDMFMGLNGIMPLQLTYELLTVHREFAVRQVCDYLGADAPPYNPALIRVQRQATALNDAWRARFLSGQ